MRLLPVVEVAGPVHGQREFRKEGKPAGFGQGHRLGVVDVLVVNVVGEALGAPGQAEAAAQDLLDAVEGALDHLGLGVFHDRLAVRAGHDDSGMDVLGLDVQDIDGDVEGALPLEPQGSHVGEDPRQVTGELGAAVVGVDAPEGPEDGDPNPEAQGR